MTKKDYQMHCLIKNFSNGFLMKMDVKEIKLNVVIKMEK